MSDQRRVVPVNASVSLKRTSRVKRRLRIRRISGSRVWKVRGANEPVGFSRLYRDGISHPENYSTNSRLSLSLSLPKVVHGEGRGKKFHVFAIIIAKIRATEWDERRVNRSRIIEIYYFEQNTAEWKDIWGKF